MSDKKDYFGGLPDDPDLGVHFLAFSSGVEPGPEANFLHSADQANMELVVKELDSGMPINSASPTGLTALHIAVARDNVPLARLLIERGAKPGPDALGRWPSMIAGLCEVSEEMCDLIAEAEDQTV